MGFLDKVKQAVQGKSGQINKAVDSATRQINKRTNNKWASKLEQGTSKLKQQVTKLDRRSSPAAPSDAQPDAVPTTHLDTHPDSHVDRVTPRPPDPSPPHISRPTEGN